MGNGRKILPTPLLKFVFYCEHEIIVAIGKVFFYNLINLYLKQYYKIWQKMNNFSEFKNNFSAQNK